jgi:hypothetical protein
MVRTQQTFPNEKPWPIYISVEPWPRCFELMPKDKLTLIWHAPETGDAAQIELISDKEIVVWPEGEIDDIEYLINDIPAKDRSWDFKYFAPPSPKAAGLWATIGRIFR